MTATTPTTPLVVEAVRRHGTITLEDLAAELDLTHDAACAAAGGLHDHGYVTRYGSTPGSLVAWQQIDDEYVDMCLASVRASIRNTKGTNA